jgi:predicted 3-demethylubiquinone-9 3-methyltransferase (glyoxalase superfamily)
LVTKRALHISLAICNLNILRIEKLTLLPVQKAASQPEVTMNALENFPRITPFLWFDSNAEEAVDFYLTIFKDSRRLSELCNTGDAPGPKGGILPITFELEGQKFTALNGGPAYKFNEAVSFVVRCDTQQEVDDYWATLTEGGSEIACGWLATNLA